MTTTLVLAGVHTPVSRYAESLLTGDGTRVLRPLADEADPALSDTISTVTEPAFASPPEGWVTEESNDLVRSILYARGAVLVDNLAAWVAGKITAANAWDAPEKANAAVTDATLELAALLSALPYDAVVISRELGLMVAAGAPVDRTLQDALGLANTVLSNHLSRAVLLMGGRAVDLSAFPALPY
ncbi:bifunctional adenosylcobinamide kinase/adenosylcobinamide-phosphate guanylyltransferase [Branchiibius cervicis]|uniref:Bifunctional adenosylcobinamide kinase/adenosylcobinamide-phosphate guanylyltransferase n=1 Tax=Branchiibius cervicis TaxID=908252 RepID=A0ABW2AS75_9MICO